MMPAARASDRAFAVTAHRPWPLPARPWIMSQSWHDLLFAHWPVDAALLRTRVPRTLPLDLFEGRAWVGIVPFWMTGVAPRGVPSIPPLSDFPELNVRTYVSLDGKPGVYFFSLDAAQRAAVAVARTVFRLPYFFAHMRVERDGDWIRYRSRRRGAGPPAAFEARYRPDGPARPAGPGTLEYFLAERYCLYTVDGRLRPRRLEIQHPPWMLQPAVLELHTSTMAEASGLPLPPVPPLLHFSKRQDMVAYWGELVEPVERLERLEAPEITDP